MRPEAVLIIGTLPVSIWFEIDELAWIKKSRYWISGICEPSAHYHIVVYASGVSGEQPLTRSKQSLSEEPDLSAVGVTAEDEIYISSFEIGVPIFRMMAQKQLISLETLESAEP